MPLASPAGAETFPKFDDDGGRVAFVGNYDGDRDLYAANDFGPNVLYRNNGDWTFTDITREAGVWLETPRYALGVVAADYDGVFQRLVVGGELTGLGLNNISNLAAWNGFGWEAYGSGVNDTVYALTVADVDDGWGPLLVAGGDFTYQLDQSVDDIC